MVFQMELFKMLQENQLQPDMPSALFIILLYAAHGIWFLFRAILPIWQTGYYIVSHKIRFFARAPDEIPVQ